MSYSPIITVWPLFDGNGDPYSGAVLKCYENNGTTVLQMATDSTGGTLVSSIALNASGYPEVSGNVVVPHVDSNYRLTLYPTQAAADADSGEDWGPLPQLTPDGAQTDHVVYFSTFAAIRAYTGSALVGVALGDATANDGEGGIFRYVSGSPASTYTDDDLDTLVPSGGDGSAAWLRVTADPYSLLGATADLDGVSFKNYSEVAVSHGNMGSTETIDLENGNYHYGTLDDNCTFTFSNPAASGSVSAFTLELTQDGTGSRTVTWPASVDWSNNGTAPTLSTGAGDIDIFVFWTRDNGTKWFGVEVGFDFA